jgi:hypothetical protein
MPEVTIEVSKDIKDLVGEAGEAIYIETLKEVAFKRMGYRQKELKELDNKITFRQLWSPDQSGNSGFRMDPCCGFGKSGPKAR